MESDERITKEPEEINTDSRNRIKCKTCGKTFQTNCEFEKHVEEHDLVKMFKCEVCGKDFYLKWRLQKHMSVHTEAAKPCKYFVSNENYYHTSRCPRSRADRRPSPQSWAA